VPLAQVTLADAQAVDPAFDRDVLACANPLSSIGRKLSVGSTGPAAVDAQIGSVREAALVAAARAAKVPRLATLFDALKVEIP